MNSKQTQLSITSTPPSSRSRRRRIRLLSIIEASTVTGPVKNLLEFCRIARNLEAGPTLETCIITFQRIGVEPPDAQLAPTEFAEEAVRSGIEVYCIRERFAFDPQVISSLKQIVGRFAPDIVQSHGLKSHFLVRLCGVHSGRQWVAFHHGYTNATFKRALLAHFDRWSLRAPSQVVAVSEAFARDLSSRGVPPRRITALHNAIDPEWLLRGESGPNSAVTELQRDALIKPQGEKLVLAVGRLSRDKGFTDLITAIRHLNEMRPPFAVRLVIVGEGLERQSIEAAGRRAGLAHQLRLVGHVKDLRPFYRVADLLAISSLSEGSPNVLLEAMAAGVPVVATAVGGIPEIVEDTKTGLLVPSRDPAALGMAIHRLLCDSRLAEGIVCQARELVKTKFSPLFRAQTLVKLYERLCFPDTTGGGSLCP